MYARTIRAACIATAAVLIWKGELRSEVLLDTELGQAKPHPVIPDSKCGMNGVGMVCLVDGHLVLLPGEESGHREADSRSELFKSDRDWADRAREGARRVFNRER